jgi:hypothetical protein
MKGGSRPLAHRFSYDDSIYLATMVPVVHRYADVIFAGGGEAAGMHLG